MTLKIMMKERLRRTSFLLFGLLGLFAKGDEPLEWDFVRADVGDVTEAGAEPLRISVIFDAPESWAGPMMTAICGSPIPRGSIPGSLF